MSYFDRVSKNFVVDVPKERGKNVEKSKSVFLMAVSNEVFEEMKQGSCTLKKCKLKTTAG